MAFDRARIEKTFKEDESYPYMGDFLQSSTFHMVADYLTGKNPGLNGLIQDYQMQHLIHLWSLIENVENPTANDQLIWNVFFHPDVIPISIHNLSIKLVQYGVDKNTDKSIQTLISRLQQAGLGNTDIFTIVINYMIYSENSYVAFIAIGSPVKN